MYMRNNVKEVYLDMHSTPTSVVCIMDKYSKRDTAGKEWLSPAYIYPSEASILGSFSTMSARLDH